jgi:hypothetical protein
MYAQEWLPSLPFDFRVEGCDELRAAVAAVAARFTAAVSTVTGVPERDDEDIEAART